VEITDEIYYPLKIFVVAVKVLDLLTGVSIAFFLFCMVGAVAWRGVNSKLKSKMAGR